MGMNRDCIGKTYKPMEIAVTAEATKKYALAYNDDNPHFLEERRPGGIVAPPMFGVVYGGLSVAAPLFDAELKMNVAMMVHGEQEMKWFELVRPGDTIRSVAKIQDILDKGSGELCQVLVECTNQHGKKVLDSVYGFFVRGGGSGKKSEGKAEEPRGQEAFRAQMPVTEDQTYRYADASGDRNPIHVNPEFAVKVGLPGIILQGLCTMAFCQKAVLDHCANRDPARLKQLFVRFSKPVLPKDQLSTQGWLIEGKAGRSRFGFETTRPDGTAVIKNGLAEVAG